jgi:membrane-bound serine protease (ClpP class)
MDLVREEHGRMRITRAIGVLVGVTLLLALWPALGAEAQTPPTGRTVKVLTLDGAVDPFIARYLKNGIESAGREGATAVVIRIDTPGGLGSSMDTIVNAILRSPVPVLCWTGPSGARAASAGAFIMMACSWNAMAPGTRIGAAHPVGISGTVEKEKVTNDAVASIQSLADRNGYDPDFAARAVRDSVSIPAQQAFTEKPPVTKAIAGSIPDVLRLANHQPAVVGSDAVHVTLATDGATTVEQSPGLGASLLHGLINPNLAFIFFYLGIILIIIELLHPGVSVPGILGTLLLVAAFLSFGVLPVQLGGVVLLVASAVLYLLELKHPGIGLPAVGGTVCLVLGGLLLFDPSVPDLRVSRWLLLVVPTLVVAFFAVVVQAALEARRQPPMIDVDQLYGEEGVALTNLAPRGEVRLGGEHWSAEAAHGSISAGTVVRVVGRNGLKLVVVPDPSQIGGPPMAPSVPGPDDRRG